MIDKWGDAKKFIFEDILIYSLVIAIDIAHDFLMNLFHAVGLILTPTPYDFGMGQILILVVFGWLLWRKIEQWKYYR